MTSLDAALAWLLTHVSRPLPRTVRPLEGLYHTLAAPAPIHLSPPHPTAALDGHAVRAADTQGASEYAPLPLAATLVQAGDPIPPGADAVLPPPWFEQGCATAPLAPGQNVIPPGRDGGPAPLAAGTWLRPLHIPLLASNPTIHPMPSVCLLDPTPILEALFATVSPPIVTRIPDLILTCATPPADVAIRTIAIRPGEPTALGHLDGSPSRPTPAIFLPRLAEDCAAAFDLLVAPTFRRLMMLPEPQTIPATLSRKIASSLGITEAVRVHLLGSIATPLPAGLAAAEANALVLVPEGSEGYPQGATVQVHLLP